MKVCNIITVISLAFSVSLVVISFKDDNDYIVPKPHRSGLYQTEDYIDPSFRMPEHRSWISVSRQPSGSGLEALDVNRNGERVALRLSQLKGIGLYPMVDKESGKLLPVAEDCLSLDPSELPRIQSLVDGFIVRASELRSNLGYRVSSDGTINFHGAEGEWSELIRDYSKMLSEAMDERSRGLFVRMGTGSLMPESAFVGLDSVYPSVEYPGRFLAHFSLGGKYQSTKMILISEERLVELLK